MALVVRKEGEGIRRYVHLGTGNYNPATARSYTDMGLLTCRPDFGADASELFNYLTGYSKQTHYRKLLVAPDSLRAGAAGPDRARNQEAQERRRRPAHLQDEPPGGPRYHRGAVPGVTGGREDRPACARMCCLRPGVPRVSENIRVVSIVGRFLEHSRIFYFRNGGKDEILMGSADLMPRNLDHRVETLFPIEDEGIRTYVLHDVLEAYLRDNVKARVLSPMACTCAASLRRDSPPFDAQKTPHRTGHKRV